MCTSSVHCVLGSHVPNQHQDRLSNANIPHMHGQHLGQKFKCQYAKVTEYYTVYPLILLVHIKTVMITRMASNAANLLVMLNLLAYMVQFRCLSLSNIWSIIVVTYDLHVTTHT